LLTKTDVEYAYRLFLGREPENAALVDVFRNKFADLPALRQAFLASEEFRAEVSDIVGASAGYALKPLTWPPLNVETSATPADLAAMVGEIESVWSAYGESDPHWSVLTNEAYRAEKIDVTKEAFYETGRHNVQILEATAARCGVNLPVSGRCLELGCGVGRVTSWLAKRFAYVTAVDISAPHLALAAAHLSGEGLTNVTWSRLDKLDALADFTGFDVFFSSIALQHNPPPIMAIILRDALRALAPGGVAYFQIPTYRLNYAFKAKNYLMENAQTRTMEMHALPQPDLFRVVADCDCRILEIREDNASGMADMITNVVFVQRAGS